MQIWGIALIKTNHLLDSRSIILDLQEMQVKSNIHNNVEMMKPPRMAYIDDIIGIIFISYDVISYNIFNITNSVFHSINSISTILFDRS